MPTKLRTQRPAVHCTHMENLVHEDLLENLQISAAVGLEQRADGVHALYTPREAVGEQPLAPPHDVHQACTVTHVKVKLVFLCVELLHTLLLLQVEVLWVDCRLRTAHSTTVERLLHLHRQALRHLRELRLVQQRRVGRNGSDACSLGGGLGFLQECHTTCQVNMWCSSKRIGPERAGMLRTSVCGLAQAASMADLMLWTNVFSISMSMSDLAAAVIDSKMALKIPLSSVGNMARSLPFNASLAHWMRDDRVLSW